jgi:tripartite-type tricarboxylate transporter receptor subunit TctC
VHPDQPGKTVPQLVDFLKANRGKATYAFAGSGTANQIAAELLKRTVNTPDIVRVPYKGSTLPAQAVLANEVNFSFLSMPPAVSNIAAGKMRVVKASGATID